MRKSNERHIKIGVSLQGLEVRSVTIMMKQLNWFLQKEFTAVICSECRWSPSKVDFLIYISSFSFFYRRTGSPVKLIIF